MLGNLWKSSSYQVNEPKIVHSDLFGLLKLIKLGYAGNEKVYKDKYFIIICICYKKFLICLYF